MRYLLLLFSCCSALAQLPVIPFSGLGKGPLTPCGTPAYAPPTTSLFIELLADDATSCTNTVNGSDVTNWFDLSPAHHNFTNGIVINNPTKVLSPAYRSSGYTPNGCPTLDFFVTSGAPHGFRSVEDFTTNQPCTWYFVMQLDPNNGWSVTQTLIDSGAGNRQLYAHFTDGTGEFFYAGTIVRGPVMTQTNWMVWTFQFNGASSFVRTNGVNLIGTSSIGTFAIREPLISCDVTANGQTSGRISAVLCYGDAHSSGQMQAIEAGLKSRYSVP